MNSTSIPSSGWPCRPVALNAATVVLVTTRCFPMVALPELLRVRANRIVGTGRPPINGTSVNARPAREAV